MKAGRWIVALPLGVAAAVAANFFLAFIYGVAHGFDEVMAFMDATDMNGMYVEGTYMLLVTRVVTAALLVGVPTYFVPNSHRPVGYGLAAVVIVLAVVVFSSIAYALLRASTEVGFGVWYRAVLELAGVIVGSVVGAGVGIASGGQRSGA